VEFEDIMVDKVFIYEKAVLSGKNILLKTKESGVVAMFYYI
jgi:hypothetical protein